MLERTLNLGVLAHVDAGKTSLTERLLYAAGTLAQLGSVDAGTTQTDTLELERRRGITIKAAVASFRLGELTVNLIDTPGHPDFIAEVERVLNVLDGAVLVVSAVEGVQAQTRVLLRALQRLRVPTLVFVNKIDRCGARYDSLLRDLAEKLSPTAVALGAIRGLGTIGAQYHPFDSDDPSFRARLLEVLTVHDEVLLEAYVEEKSVSPVRLCRALSAQARKALVQPVLFGSALTGAGVAALLTGIGTLLPPAEGDAAGPVSGAVFKIERGPAGEKIAYVRMFSGTVSVRDRLHFGAGREGKVTAISVFERGAAVQREALAAGRLGKLWGLGDVQIGDALGTPRTSSEHPHFAPPTLETVIVPRLSAAKSALHVALTQLAEQDPLIDLRQDDTRQELYLSLYGEVQKEIIQATLENDYGLEVDFLETTPLCVERPLGTGAAAETIGKKPNPFQATVGLRLEPAPLETGVAFGLEVSFGSMLPAFFKAVETTVYETLRQGLCGWQVTDCTVTMTHSGYSSVMSTAGDFRSLTPLVLMSALKQAGTVVCEPHHRFVLETPADTLGPVLSALARLRAVLQTQLLQGASYVLKGDLPAARVHDLQQQLPGLTRGEGVLECAFDRFESVRGLSPSRPRIAPDPLNRKTYLTHVLGWWGAKGHHDL